MNAVLVLVGALVCTGALAWVAHRQAEKAERLSKWWNRDMEETPVMVRGTLLFDVLARREARHGN